VVPLGKAATLSTHAGITGKREPGAPMLTEIDLGLRLHWKNVGGVPALNLQLAADAKHGEKTTLGADLKATYKTSILRAPTTLGLAGHVRHELNTPKPDYGVKLDWTVEF
jgi:hypothetical protein